MNRKRLDRLSKHYKKDPTAPPTLKSGGRKNNTATLTLQDTQQVVQFIRNYAEEHAISLPGRVPGFKRDGILLLPSAHVKSSIYRRYKQSAEQADDLNEISEIPFFDVSLPREVAIKIFWHLDIIDLCRCAQVSKSWRSLAEDELLWCNISHSLGFETDALTVEHSNWKSRIRHKTMFLSDQSRPLLMSQKKLLMMQLTQSGPWTIYSKTMFLSDQSRPLLMTQKLPMMQLTQSGPWTIYSKTMFLSDQSRPLLMSQKKLLMMQLTQSGPWTIYSKTMFLSDQSRPLLMTQKKLLMMQLTQSGPWTIYSKTMFLSDQSRPLLMTQKKLLMMQLTQSGPWTQVTRRLSPILTVTLMLVTFFLYSLIFNKQVTPSPMLHHLTMCFLLRVMQVLKLS
ncbi:hypothetical protein ACOMHN_019093 [Nucella lapillus]